MGKAIHRLDSFVIEGCIYPIYIYTPVSTVLLLLDVSSYLRSPLPSPRLLSMVISTPVPIPYCSPFSHFFSYLRSHLFRPSHTSISSLTFSLPPSLPHSPSLYSCHHHPPPLSYNCTEDRLPGMTYNEPLVDLMVGIYQVSPTWQDLVHRVSNIPGDPPCPSLYINPTRVTPIALSLYMNLALRCCHPRSLNAVIS